MNLSKLSTVTAVVVSVVTVACWISQAEAEHGGSRAKPPAAPHPKAGGGKAHAPHPKAKAPAKAKVGKATAAQKKKAQKNATKAKHDEKKKDAHKKVEKKGAQGRNDEEGSRDRQEEEGSRDRQEGREEVAGCPCTTLFGRGNDLSPARCPSQASSGRPRLRRAPSQRDRTCRVGPQPSRRLAQRRPKRAFELAAVGVRRDDGRGQGEPGRNPQSPRRRDRRQSRPCPSRRRSGDW